MNKIGEFLDTKNIKFDIGTIPISVSLGESRILVRVKTKYYVYYVPPELINPANISEDEKIEYLGEKTYNLINFIKNIMCDKYKNKKKYNEPLLYILSSYQIIFIIKYFEKNDKEITLDEIKNVINTYCYLSEYLDFYIWTYIIIVWL